MTGGSHSVPPPIAGRVDELRVLGEAVERAADGEPSAVFVHGEAGVGKTRLARTAAELARARGFEVLWGRCLRFGAVQSVLLPWVVAIEGWLADAGPDDRATVLDAVPGAAALLPSLGGGRPEDSTQLVSVAGSLVARVVALRPTVLVLDDVQWADAASRDALSYVVAGFGRQSHLVLATYRDEGLPHGDPLFGWMADLRRLPRVTDLALGRLNPEETEQQLTLLLGGSPTRGVVDAVQDRSGGNAYLSELLAQGLSPDADTLPAGLPSDLSTALIAVWHRLAPAAREAVRVLAVSGRPSPADLVVEVGTAVGWDGREVRRGLAEAVAVGVVVPEAGGRLWLRHPLLAEVLYETYLAVEVAPVHRAWAARLAAARPAVSAADELRRLGDLALHHDRGGDLEAAFDASIAAADQARAHRLWREEAVHLQRAAGLWSRLTPEYLASYNEAALLERAAIASGRVGRDDLALQLGTRALALSRRAGDTLRTSRLLILSEASAWWLGQDVDQEVGAREAVHLVSGQPNSREYAEALANLAEELAWKARWSDAGPVADEAVAAAHRSGSLAAMAAAHSSRSQARMFEDVSEFDSAEGLRHAIATGDPELIRSSATQRGNRLLDTGRLREATGLGEWALARAVETGALGAALWSAGGLARNQADEGRLRDAAETVRTGLSLSGVGNGAANLRLSAVVVSVRRGDLDAAALHLRRAYEQIPTLAMRPGLEAPPKLVELMLAEGRPREALGLVFTTLGAHAGDPRALDLMMVWGVRAAADMAQRSRDRGDRSGVRRARNLLHRLAQTRDRLPGAPFVGTVPGDPVMTAWRALRDAEVARFDAAPSPDAWRNAVRHCDTAGLGWDAQVARLRLGSALLAAGAPRAEVAVPLRAAHGYAVAEEAEVLRHEVEGLAASARVSLAEPAVVTVPAQRTAKRGPLDGLTPREQEVLSLLVAGRTYAEIARALYISDKTVSAHVSHLLRKTGTASRHEVSALVLRLQATAAAP